MEEGFFPAGVDPQQAIGLGGTARDFGEEFCPGDSDRDRQSGLFEDPAYQSRGDLGRGPGDMFHATDLKEGLVD